MRRARRVQRTGVSAYLGRPDCSRCRGTGWISVEAPGTVKAGPDGQPYRTMGSSAPCPCRRDAPAPRSVESADVRELDRRRLAAGEREEDIA